MRFVFNERKTAQAAAFLMEKAGGTMNYMVLIKLLYLSDREALIRCGAPITGDHMVSMPHGPVLSEVLDLINMGQPQKPTPWFEYITEPADYEVSLIEHEGELDELSRFEESVLGKVFERYGMMSKWHLRDLTHTLPEWQDPKGSSLPIRPETILQAAGKSSADIQRITREAESVFFIDSLQAAS